MGKRMSSRTWRPPTDHRTVPSLDQACALNAIAQPEQFVEIGEALAKEKGIARRHGKRISKRGFIKAKAVVTKRIQALTIDGRTVNTIGIPSLGL
jgi:anaerobic selenocysteine-containing dehydrogenase